jgi:orsellinic acid C2-O-methyltransferase
VVRGYDFAGMRRIVDVGGGHGALLAAVLAVHPRMQGVIFDLPHAIAGAKTYLAKAGVSERCELMAGDFFKSLPRDADAYLLKNIIHDWDDERAARILRNCRRAMPAHGKLLLIEQITPGRLEPSPAHRAIAWIDLAMLIGQAGCQRTEAEICALLASSGLAPVRTFKTALNYSIIECV